MRDSQGKPWNPHLSEWARDIQDEIRGKKSGVFYATGICPGCGDMIDRQGLHGSTRNTCPGVTRK